MSSIRVSTSGELDDLLEQLQKIEGVDKKGISTSIGEILRSNTWERFESERGPDGSAWKKSIRAKESGGKTLIISTDLKSSINVRASTNGVEVGTNKVYAATHQFGADGRTIRAKTKKGLVFKRAGKYIRKRQVTVNIPARPFIGISEEDIQDIKDLIEEVLSEQ